MQFSDTSNLNGIIQDITGHTGVDLNEFPLKDRTRRINQWRKRTILKIIRASKEWGWKDTSLGVSSDNSWTPATDDSLTRDLAAGTRLYALPTTNKLWLIWRVAVMLDGANYFDADPYHIGQVNGMMSDTQLDEQGSIQTPIYRIIGNSIEVRPAPAANVTAGIKIWAVREPTEYASTDTTKQTEIEAAFEDILSLGPSYEWARNKGKANAEQMKRDLNELHIDLMNWISGKLDDSQPSASPEVPNYR